MHLAETRQYGLETGLHRSAFRMEHALAWIMSLGSMTLALIGALVAFDVISLRELNLTDIDAAATEAALNFQDGALLLIPATSAAILAMTLHLSDHHRGDVQRERLFGAEHAGAYLAAVVAVVFILLDIVIGLNVFNGGNNWRDGLTWGLLSLTAAFLTATLHAVGHHVHALDEEHDIVRIVDERISSVRLNPGGVGSGTPRPSPRS